MENSSFAFANIVNFDPTLFEDLLEDMGKTQEPYIKSLKEDIAEKKEIQNLIRGGFMKTA